jgi:hypothetical protein
MLSLGQGKASIAGWRCMRSLSWGGRLTSIGVTINIMTLLSTVEASDVHFIRCFILSGWGSLSTLFPSVWSLKVIGVRNHLLLRGDKSLSSRLRHQLKTLSDRAEDRCSSRKIDIDAVSGVGALLGLTLLLALCVTVFLFYSRAQEPCLPWPKNSQSLRLIKHRQVHHPIH